jgi:NitT/TauT family transport system substrate-binding protein
MARATVGRALLALTALCVLCADLPACSAQPAVGSGSASEAQTTLRVCTSSIAPSHLSIPYALAEHIFREHRLDVQVTEISGGSTAAAALVAGSVDLCQMAGNAVVNAVVAGAELVIVAGVTNRLPYYLVARPEITTPAQLRGKALAVSAPGSGSYSAARAALDRFGIIPDQGVAILSIGGEAERLTALTSGRVAAAVLSPPLAILAMDQGYRSLLDYTDFDKPYPHEVIVTTRGFLKRQPSLVTAYLEATSESIAAMQANKARATEVMAGYLHMDRKVNAAALDRTYDLLITGDMASRLTPSLQGIQALLDELADDNPRAVRVAPADIVDSSILEQLDREGFFTRVLKIRE